MPQLLLLEGTIALPSNFPCPFVGSPDILERGAISARPELPCRKVIPDAPVLRARGWPSVLLIACGGNGVADNATQPSANATAAAQLIATATVTPEPMVRPIAAVTATPKPPTPTLTRLRPTLTPTVALPVAPTATVPRPALTTVGTDTSGKCRIGLPDGFVPADDPPDTWRSADRFITVSLTVPDSSVTPTLAAVTATGVTALQQRLSGYQEVAQVKGRGHGASISPARAAINAPGAASTYASSAWIIAR